MNDKYRNTPKGRIAPNGYRLCDPLQEGEQLTDNKSKIWVIGKPIGCGGFGEIYLCHEKNDPKRICVMKLDNLNGPLFVEVNFVIRVCQEEKVQNFIARNGIDFLGFPKFIAWGTDSAKKNGYRFLIMDRLGEELQKVLEKHRLSIPSTCRIACRILDVLEYIHEQGYIHADIKAQNILRAVVSKTDEKPKKRVKKRPLIDGSDDSGNVEEDDKYYLIDYGLVELYNFQGTHKPYECDKRKANNGTCEFRSRDAHIGVISRRSDIESLGYNIILWFYGRHPWENMLKNVDHVHEKKVWAMNHIDDFLNEAFSDKPLNGSEANDGKGSKTPKPVASKKNIPINTCPPFGLNKFFKEIQSMEHDAKPDYKKLKSILKEIANLNPPGSPGLTSNGSKRRVNNVLSSVKKTPVSRKKRKSEELELDSIDSTSSSRAKRTSANMKTPLKSKSNQILSNGELNGSNEIDCDDETIIECSLPKKKGRKTNNETPKKVTKRVENKTATKPTTQKKATSVQKPREKKNVSRPKRNQLELDEDLELSDEHVKSSRSSRSRSRSTKRNSVLRRLPRISTPYMAFETPENNQPLFGPFVSDDSIKENQSILNSSVCNNSITSFYVDSSTDEDVTEENKNNSNHFHQMQQPRIYVNNQRLTPKKSTLKSNLTNNLRSLNTPLSPSDSSTTSIEEESLLESIKPSVNDKSPKSITPTKSKKTTAKSNGVSKLNGHNSSSASSSVKSGSTVRKNGRTTSKTSNTETQKISIKTKNKLLPETPISTGIVETAAMQRIRMLIEQRKHSTPKK